MINYIFDELFGELTKNKLIERKKEYETTEYIIKKPIIYYTNEREEDYSCYFYLEFENRNLSELSDKTCSEIQIVNESIIFLKFKEDNFLKELNNQEKKNLITFSFKGQFKKCLLLSYNNEILYHLLERYFKIIGKSYLFNEFIFKDYNISISGILNRISQEDFIKKIKDLKINTSFNNIEIYSSFFKNEPYLYIDPSNDKIIKSNEYIYYKTIIKGLNIFGNCMNPKCEKYNKKVIYQKGLSKYREYFDLNKEINNIKCSMCFSIFKPKICGFYNCEYQLIGKKFDEGKLINYDSKTRETKDDEREYFGFLSEEMVIWKELYIFVTNKQKIKYKSN